MKEQDNQWELDFRTLLIELDDLNQHMNNIHEPIKGDIYFDGIEVEQWIRNLLQKELQKKVSEILGKIKEMKAKGFEANTIVQSLEADLTVYPHFEIKEEVKE